MSGTRRATGNRRKPKSSKGRLVFASATTGVLAVGAITGVVIMMKPGGEKPASAQPPVATSDDAAAVPTPKTGTAVTLVTPDGYRYKIAAAIGTRKPSGEAYIDYTLYNLGGERAPLESPGDLFVDETKGGEAAKHCADAPGVPAGFCSPQLTTEVVGYLGTSPQPEIDGEDQWMPPGSGYLVRVSSNAKVGSIDQSDLLLYASQIRFTKGGKAIAIPFPKG
jgi:hypothetical protein